MNQIRCAAFDVDGTLLDSHETNYAAAVETIQELTGRTIDREFFQTIFGLSGYDTGKLIYPQDPNRYFERAAQKEADYTIRLALFPAVLAMLHSLKDAGIRLAVVTGRTRKEYENNFSSFGLDGLFDPIICADDTGKAKPDRAPMDLLVQKTGLDPQEIVYIGDTENDSASARAAGIPFYLAGWGTSDPQIPADRLLQTPQELETLLTGKKPSFEKQDS